MNKKIYILLGSIVLTVSGGLPLSATAQEPGQTGQQAVIKKQSFRADLALANADTRPVVTSVPEAKLLLPAKLPRAAKKCCPPPGDYDWGGAYIGGQIGYGWGQGDTRFEPLPSAATFINLAPTTLQPDPKGWTGGIQGGSNWQFNHFVIGGETSFSWSNIKGTSTQTPITQNNGTPFPGAGFITTTHDTEWFGTLRVRAGGAIDRVFIYGTGGFAYARINFSANTDFRPVGTTQYPAAFSQTKTGWTGGFGVEVGINPHWSWRTEFLYYDLGDTTFTANPTPSLPPFQVQYTWTTKASTFNTGINFRF